MNKLQQEFLTSLRAQLTNTSDIKSFILNETWIKSKPYSFVGHEYQEFLVDLVMNNPGAEIIVSKISQLGISEICFRILLARMKIIPGNDVLSSFPTKLQSSEIFKTRVDQIINESPALKNSINNDVNSASVKQLANGSLMYALAGRAGSDSSLISRPICDVFIDECDRQDKKVINSYGSRTTHTHWSKRLTMKVSTPTVEGTGVSAELGKCSIRYTPWVRCEHCQHLYFPDYYEDVRVPGYYGSLQMLNTQTAAKLDLRSAYLQCPECKKAIVEQNYEWVREDNPEGTHLKIGLVLTPFVCKAFVSMGDLVSAMLEFDSISEYRNQKLGLTASLKDSTILRTNIHFEHSDRLNGQYLLGLDTGKMNTLAVGVMRPDTSIHILEVHMVPLHELDVFMDELHRRYTFTAEVMDAGPLVDKVYAYVKKYQRMYSAIWVSPAIPQPQLFKLSIEDKHNQVVRQMALNAGPFMDMFADSLDTFFSFEPTPMENVIVNHILSMRRVRDYRFEEMIYRWQKSDAGVDHAYYALNYLYAASKLAAAGLVKSTAIPCTIRKINPELRKLKKKTFA